MHMSSMLEITIRKAGDADLNALLDVHRRAFKDEGNVIAELVENLFNDPTARPIVSLLAEDNGRAVGHILFTAANFEDAEIDVPCSILAPLAVVPEMQSKGLGGLLIEEGFKQLSNMGCDLVLFSAIPDIIPATVLIQPEFKALKQLIRYLRRMQAPGWSRS